MLRRWTRRSRLVAILFGIGVLGLFVVLPVVFFDLLVSGQSRCFGKRNDGSIEHAVRPPFAGKNYRTYCYICVIALRTFGHQKAIESMAEAYEVVARERPRARFVYGEIGWPWGGRFAPHRTHRNGLSIDFMVPLKGAAEIPTHAFNKFGYDVEFDRQGKGEVGEIDFATIALHLIALDKAARKRGGRIARVILAPDLQDDLINAAQGSEFQRRIRFNKGSSWVRHDEHYHVDFSFPCAGSE